MSELAKLLRLGWSIGFIEYRGGWLTDRDTVFAVSLWRMRTNNLHGMTNCFGYGPTLPKAIKEVVAEAKKNTQ